LRHPARDPDRLLSKDEAAEKELKKTHPDQPLQRPPRMAWPCPQGAG